MVSGIEESKEGQKLVTVLNRVVRDSVTEKMTFQRRFEEVGSEPISWSAASSNVIGREDA